MSLLLELTTYLATQGVGTVGTNLFAGFMPDTPHACGTLYEYGGAPPDLGFSYPGIQHENSAVQMVFRGNPTDYSSPRAKSETVYRLFTSMKPGLLTGTKYLQIRANQSPFLMQRDGLQRVYIVCNYICLKELSVA